jgi:hypothetical protein
MCIDLHRCKKNSQDINHTHQHDGVEEEQNSEDEELTRPRTKHAASKKSQQALSDGISELTSSEDPDWEMDIISENNVDKDDDLDGSEMMDVDLDSDTPRTSKSTAAGKAKKAKPQSTTKTGEQKEKGKQDDIRSAVMAGCQKKPSVVCYNNFPMAVLFVDE